MDYKNIKIRANEILEHQAEESSYIEYKTSGEQLSKILKTICAFGNNYYDNDVQYIFLGVKEKNDAENKAVPEIPIEGIPSGKIEKVKNSINSLRSYIYPNVKFELITNEFGGKKYILIAVFRQTGGPFMVSEKAGRDKEIKLRPGRYVRVEAETRLARVDEEYDLLRKFSNYHFSSITSKEATVDDLNIDYLTEYINKTSEREIMDSLSKQEIVKSLKLTDRNDPDNVRVKNFAILMFSNEPEKFIPYAYTEMIVDMFGTKRKMESKKFTGPIWKQYFAIISYIRDYYLNEIVIRSESAAENRKVANFPFSAVEELVANAIVHNNYENAKAIQIYISEKQINIVNYNKPLPPLRVEDLNERYIFDERDTVNPEIRDMFKALGIIESFGTGIGEAKRALERNGSPELYYRYFSEGANITSVVIPVNEEYLKLKSKINSNSNLGIDAQFQGIKSQIVNSKYKSNIKQNLLTIYGEVGDEIFGNSRVSNILKCSDNTATAYIKKLYYELKIIKPVEGHGKGKYKFVL